MRMQIIVNCFAKLLNSLLIELFMLKNWRFTAHALLLAFAALTAYPCFAQDMNLVGRMCPADLSTYALQDGTSCDPKGEAAKACDRRFNAPSRPWHECYQEISVCQDRINEYNRKTTAYNNWVNQCRDADKKRIDDLQRTAKTTPNSGSSPSSNSSLSAALAKAKEAAKNEAKNSALDNSKARLELDTQVQQKKAADEARMRAEQAAADARLRAQ
ncbi:hypothetical protein SAMN05216338_108421, partial [Bradyrhizobium sp. Rc2d]|uniref:hypothetical protein n=1 Tax=Bradyrhizobium sp. Rc2d TaxID=1855321 RepID=UPI000884D6B5